MKNSELNTVVSQLRQLPSVRTQCRKIFDLGCANQLEHFSVHLEKLGAVVDAVHALMVQDYTNFEVPNHSRWRHFEAAGAEWRTHLEQDWRGVDRNEWLKRHCDLIVVSVLLDAGAGPHWVYQDPVSEKSLTRSEGLGVASLRLFEQGMFSSDPTHPARVDAAALSQLTLQKLEAGFQVSPENPMVGLAGRLDLLRSLGTVLRNETRIFAGSESARPGDLIDGLGLSSRDHLSLSELWHVVIWGLKDIWPTSGRTHFQGECLGDVWHHSKLGASTTPEALIPFHKLSQWLTYSLLEPFLHLGLQIDGMQELTGLPEYRNGGLFIDYDVLRPKSEDVFQQAHTPQDELIIEWRALTVILLDLVAERLREKTGLSPQQLSLARVLEGGTWKAGRRIAAHKRAGGVPPIQVVSDGTVF